MADCLVVNKEPVDSQVQYSRVQDLLRSPVVAAVIFSSAALIAATMLKSQSSLPDGPDSSTEKASSDLGTIHVVHSQKGGIVMQQILTGPNQMEYGREVYGPIQVGPIKLGAQLTHDGKLDLKSDYFKLFNNNSGSLTLDGKIWTY